MLTILHCNSEHAEGTKSVMHELKGKNYGLNVELKTSLGNKFWVV